MTEVNVHLQARDSWTGRMGRVGGGEPVLLVVAAVEDVDHALGVGVAEVGVVGRPVVDHLFCYRVRRLVREDARRHAAHHLLHLQLPFPSFPRSPEVGLRAERDLELVRAGEDVVVDGHVLAEEVQVARHVREQAAHLRRQVDHVRRLHALEHRLRGLQTGGG